MHGFLGPHSTMKVPAAALAALLLVAICSPAEAYLGDSGVAASSQKPGLWSLPGREPCSHWWDPHVYGEGWEQVVITGAGTQPQEWRLPGGSPWGIEHRWWRIPWEPQAEPLPQRGVSLGLSLCPHRHFPHRLLLHIPAPTCPTQTHHLCLHHQQHMHPASSDVSTQHCQALGWDSQSSNPSVSEGGQEGEGGKPRDMWGAASGNHHRHPIAPAEHPNIHFLPAAWSPRRGGWYAQTLRSPGWRRIWSTSRCRNSDPSPLPPQSSGLSPPAPDAQQSAWAASFFNWKIYSNWHTFVKWNFVC